MAMGPMAEVVFGSTQYLSPDDARAIAAYMSLLVDSARLTNQSSSTVFDDSNPSKCTAPSWPIRVMNLRAGSIETLSSYQTEQSIRVFPSMTIFKRALDDAPPSP